MMVEVGNVCMKNTGRESGKYCVVLKKINDSFVSVTGPKLLTGIKRRRCNVDHLNPTAFKIEVNENSSDEEVIAALDKQNLITKLKLKRPSAAQLKEQSKKEKEKELQSKEVKETKESKKETKKGKTEKEK